MTAPLPLPDLSRFRPGRVFRVAWTGDRVRTMEILDLAVHEQARRDPVVGRLTGRELTLSVVAEVWPSLWPEAPEAAFDLTPEGEIPAEGGRWLAFNVRYTPWLVEMDLCWVQKMEEQV